MKEYLECDSNVDFALLDDEVMVVSFDDLPLGFEVQEAWSMQED
ncbi:MULTISPECIES: hypothetical protein [Moraxella]|nr:hypothetical protein [Moraxella sp. ZY171148]